MTVTVYTNAEIFTGDDTALAQAVAVKDGRVEAVGSYETVTEAVSGQVQEVDLAGAFVTPGLTEGHTHLTMFGQALSKVQLRDCETLEEIQDRLATARKNAPDAKYLLGVSWRFEAIPNSEPTAAMIDEVVSDIPVLLDANDLHSTWVNSAALDAMGIGADTPNPVGGEIVRDSSGQATGFMKETAAVVHCWEYVTAVATDADRDEFLQKAFAAYIESGVTACTEMALDRPGLDALIRFIKREGNLPFPVAAHWLVQATGDPQKDLAQVHEAIAAREEVDQLAQGSNFSIAGVKFILDGVIDACTAAMKKPYANGELPNSIWSEAAATPVAIAADAAGLQLALHAIGDAASELAVRLVSACVDANGERESRRPRIEHLESVVDETMTRMAALNIAASMQPVHCDPAIMSNWKEVLGDERAETGFPWHKFREAGVRMILGTDAPTAPHDSLENLLIALTAKSALDPKLEAYHPERVFAQGDALLAYSVAGAETSWPDQPVGIVVGAPASFTVFDTNLLKANESEIRSARVIRTIICGEEHFSAK